MSSSDKILPPGSRRRFIKSVGYGALAYSLSDCTGGNRRQDGDRHRPVRPNILLITTDYQKGSDGPSLGSPFLEMPTLDRFCREGAVLSRHHCTAPICMPARYTLITGQYPHSHGAQDNQGRWLPEGSPVLMKLLKQAGYHTYGVGKMHFHPWERMAGFDRRIIADRKGNWIGDNKRLDDYARFLGEHGLTRFDYLKKQSEADIFGVYDWPFADNLHIDSYVGNQARRIIESESLAEPWFLWISFNGPHNPWDPPATYAARYRKMDLPKGHTFPGELRTKPRDHTRLRYNYTRRVVDRIDRDPENRDYILNQILAGHYGGLTFIDRQIDGIVAALDGQNQLDDTLIIYSADHGCHLGDHNLIHKGTHYDSSARVPMVVRYPPLIQPRKIDSLTGHVDILPTLLSLIGQPVPAAVEGNDLSPLLLGQKDKIQDQLFTEIRWSTAITTDRWKMGVYPRDGDGELYDLARDPHELENLYTHPGYKAERKELLERMMRNNPHLAGEMGLQPAARSAPVRVLNLKTGENIPAARAPRVAGRPFNIEANISYHSAESLEGVILTQFDSSHGYALYLKSGVPHFVIERYNRMELLLSERTVPAGSSRIHVSLSGNGEITIRINGEVTGRMAQEALIPRQPGHPDIIGLMRLQVGGSSQKWGRVHDYYKMPSHFNITINSLNLRIK